MASKGAVTNFAVKLQASTTRTVFAYWTWNVANTEEYRVIWSYSTGQYSAARQNVIWFSDSDTTVKSTTSTYNAPSNATQVSVRVLPIAATHGEKETPYWTASWSPVIYFKFAKTIGRNVPDSKYKVEALTVTKESGTDRTIRAQWTWKETNTSHYVVDIDYQTADKTWYNAEDSETEHKYYSYNAPTNAIAVRYRIHPIAQQYVDGDYETPWWNAKWSETKTYTFTKTAAEIEAERTDKLQNKPTSIKFNIQNGTERTVYVVWTWDKENTDHYEVAWEYSTGQGTWFAGQTDTSVTKKNALYSAPDNAKQIRCRIRAISKERKSNNVKYWTANWSSWKSYTIPKEPPDTASNGSAPAKTTAVVANLKLSISKGTTRTVLATWEWDKEHTAHFDYEWAYTNGDTVVNSKTKKKQYVWLSASSGSTSSASYKNATYSAPNEAIQVRFRVKGISSSHTVSGNSVEWWTANFCSWTAFAMPSSLSVKNLNKAPSKVTLKKQGGTDRSIYATWVWSESHVDHYDYEFEYRVGSVWFDGTEGATNGNTKQSSVYSVPDNANSARFRVQPVSTTRKGANDKDYEYWTAKRSGWVYWNCPAPTAATKSSTARNIEIDYQDDSFTTVYARWDWDGTLKGVYESDGTTLKDLTKEYRVIWRYQTKNAGPWFDGTDTTTTRTLSTYSVPNNAVKVYIRIHPIAKTHKVNGKEAAYWTAPWSSPVSFDVRESQSHEPAEASTPTVSLTGLRLKAELSTYDENTKLVEFEVIKVPSSGTSSRFKLIRVKVDRNLAIATVDVNSGTFYKVHARGIYPTTGGATDTLLSDITSTKNAVFGPWSQYTSVTGTSPAAPSKITSHSILTGGSLQINWSKSSTATGYEIEYTTDQRYFDVTDQPTKITTDNTETYRIITGLDAGKYFFRVRATNEAGASGWTPVYSAIVGTQPSAPTTWSETTTALITESVNLYWMHNSEDGSSQTDAQIRITIDNETNTYTATKLSTDDTSSYYTCKPLVYTRDDILDSSNNTILDSGDNTIYSELTSNFPEGTVVMWQVRTKGILDTWSPWSAQRSIIFYAPPTISINIEDDPESDYKMQTVRSYPVYVRGAVEPSTQKVIGYNISVLAGEAYTTSNDDGTERFINSGEVVYSKYIDSEKGSENTLLHKLSAGDIGLEDGMSYILNVSAAMDSGLTAEDTYLFYVNWDDTELLPNAEIQFDSDLYCAYIHPYCVDDGGERIDDVVLSVYRREYDGTFTLIADNIDNGDATSVTDPHPALDYARYRIVAMSTITGRIGYYDAPSIPVGITSIIIQWDEGWSNLNLEDDDITETTTWISEPAWSGSLVKFPYNIGISTDYSIDVSLIEYIGRKHPVSYYGTQLGESASWTADIPRNDFETLYQLRRLAIYPGNCYVREPSGSGYWAQVTPSFSRSYDNMLIPVTLKITRVEGGA